MDLPGATVAVFLKRVMLISPMKGGVEDMGRNGSLFVVVGLVDMAIVMEETGLTLNDSHVEGGGSCREYEMKRECTGRANWGTTDDDLIAQGTEEEANMDGKLANSIRKNRMEPENKEMTLEEYEKTTGSSEERKGSDKDMGRRKDGADRKERGNKSVSITEFRKPGEGERCYSPGGRGGGRGRV
ncbi:hypothetical protein OPV22_021946 [Ensete ventricosum]|uniref:Hyaluronan/mRNA-binding protein domain-containing protein n=1 Tax=Ensete ventricosum TaxID=4639 RepID=A0AAV8QED8_ENSVE|nr:hypothetical protein OPV22_021946 [Ensete ventricosum]